MSLVVHLVFPSMFFLHVFTPSSRPRPLEKFSAVVERQQEDEDEAGDGRERQEDPEQDEVDLLSEKFPVPKCVIDGLILFLLLRHLKKILIGIALL